MADVSKIKLLDSSEYNLKDRSGSLSSHLHHINDLVPLESKTYTNVVATANNFNGGWFFYGKLLPTDFYAIYKIHYKITSIAAGRNDTKTVCDVWICGTQSSLLAYASFNRICNTSYLAQHHNELYRATSAGITGGYGHLIGVRLQSAWNPTTAANSRTITIDILEVENCTFTFFENMTLYANVPGTGSTNYTAYTELNGTSNGLQETGDADSSDNIMAYFNLKTGAQGIWNGSLVMQDGNGTYQNICTASNGTATNSNRTTANTKLANTNGFRVGGTIYYSSGNYNANSNISSWGSIRSMQGNVFDARYSFNVTLTANSLTPYAPIYLVGTINATDGLFYLDQTWWTQTPTATDKVYVLVGGCYDSTTSNCRISLLEHNPWYKYDGTKLVELTNGHIVNKDVPANAVFTDTTYESKQEAQGGTAVSLATTGEKYNWNHGIETALVHKEYNGTNVYAESWDLDTYHWYFMSVRPDSYGASWSIKCRVLSYCTNNPEQRTDTLMEISQSNAQTPIEGCARNYQAPSYSHFRVAYKRVTSVGYTAGYGQAIGIVIDPGNSGSENYRTIIVDIFRCENCSVTLLNTPVKWSEWTGASAENYMDFAEISGPSINLLSDGYLSSVAEKIFTYRYSGTGMHYLALLTGYNAQSVVISHCFGVKPEDGYMQIAQEHTSTTSMDSGLWCGNNIPDGTAGAVRGFLNLFAANGKANYILPAENTADRLYTLPTTGVDSTLALMERTFPCYVGLSVGTLDEFVNLLSRGNGRSFSGTVKTTVDIGIGTEAGEWARVIMMSQNAPNNGSNDLGLFAIMLPRASTADIKYALITGMSTGNYTVSQYGVINRDFGVDGNLYLHGRKVLNNVSNASLYIASSSDTQYAVWLGKTGQLWTFCPNGDDKLYLGLSSYRWKQIYSTTATINTSDRNQKKDIKPLDESARDFIMSLNPVSYKMKDGDSGRTHHGMIAQDVEEEMAKLGMTPMDFAGFCKDQKTETYEVQTEDGQIERKQRVIDGEYTYGLRYEEFIPSAIKTIQLQQKEIDELRNELAEIKAMLNGGK